MGVTKGISTGLARGRRTELGMELNMENSTGFKMGITTVETMGIAMGNRMKPSMGVATGNRMELSMENSMGLRMGNSMDKTMGIKMERHSSTLPARDLSYVRRATGPHQMRSNMPCIFWHG